MTREDKDLLLKDLCGRLPYEVEVFYSTTIPFATLITINAKKGDCIVYDHSEWYRHSKFNIETIKPYLRPMESMTEEEQFQLGRLLGATSYNLLKGEYSSLKELLEYSYKNHIDLFGLIPKGLALEAPKDMYKF